MSEDLDFTLFEDTPILDSTDVSDSLDNSTSTTSESDTLDTDFLDNMASLKINISKFGGLPADSEDAAQYLVDFTA